MAENPGENKSSKGIGELFVEFGTTGLGKFLQGLNGVKAQFLLSKAAAEQFTKPLINMSKNATGGITALTKLNAVTGMSVRQLQELRTWTQLNNVSFGEMMGVIEGLQQNLLEIAMGRGNVKGFALLGLNPKEMDYRKPLEALAKIRERVQQLDEATGVLAAKELGISESVLYAFKQQNNAFNTRLLLNEKEEQSLIEQQASWNSLSASWDAAQAKFIANQQWINRLLSDTQTWLESEHPILESISKSFDWLYNSGIPGLAKFLAEVDAKFKPSILKEERLNPNDFGKRAGQEVITPFSSKNKGIPGLVDWSSLWNTPINVPSQNIIRTKPQKQKNSLSQPFELETIPDSELGADVPINAGLPPVPTISDAGSNTTNVQVAITNNITGENAAEIASRTDEKLQNTIAAITNQNGWYV